MTISTQNGRIHELTLEEGWELLDREARRYLNLGAEEFLAAWEAGKYDNEPERSEVIYVAMLIPFARRE